MSGIPRAVDQKKKKILEFQNNSTKKSGIPTPSRCSWVKKRSGIPAKAGIPGDQE